MAVVNRKQWREKDGRLIHDADCYFWGKEICTCGLIHHLNPECPADEWFWKEWGAHERQLERVPEPLPFMEPTKMEAMVRVDKILDDVFGDADGPKDAMS